MGALCGAEPLFRGRGNWKSRGPAETDPIEKAYCIDPKRLECCKASVKDVAWIPETGKKGCVQQKLA
jgi:hypothetical protein